MKAASPRDVGSTGRWSHRRLEILRAPLPHLSSRAERAALRALVVGGSHWIETENEDRLRDHVGPLILALNHLNNLEALLMPAVLIFLREGRKVSFLSDWMYRYYPVLGWLIRRSGTITVWQKEARLRPMNLLKIRAPHTDPMDETLRRLAAGGCVAFYPEGARNLEARVLKRGHHGAARAALASGAPVMPIGIDFRGRDTASRVPAFPRLVIRFGEPMTFQPQRASFAGFSEQPLDRRARTLRRLERDVTASIMRAIGLLCGKEPSEPPASGRRIVPSGSGHQSTRWETPDTCAGSLRDGDPYPILELANIRPDGDPTSTEDAGRVIAIPRRTASRIRPPQQRDPA